MKRDIIKKMCIAALLMAVYTLMTSFVSIPTFITGIGNINLGDCVIAVACVILGLTYAPAVGALGGFLADLLSGYGAYAPVTLVAKAVMAVIICLMIRKKQTVLRYIAGIVLGGLAMVLCYFIYEWALYGIAVAATNSPFNLLQIAVNGIVALAIYPLSHKFTVVKREN